MTAILLSADLMSSSKIAGAALRGGFKLETASSEQALLDKASQTAPRLVVLDLTLPGLAPGEVIARLKQMPTPVAVVGFGPHVQESRLAAASEAGCDLVVSRGQFFAQAEQIMAKYLQP